MPIDAILSFPRPSFPEAEASRVMFQICQAFLYLHSKRVMHGDIKLENILLALDNSIRIADFGTAVLSQNLRRSTFCGTLDYLAPEIVERKQKE